VCPGGVASSTDAHRSGGDRFDELLPAFKQRALNLSTLGSAAVVAAWSATSMVVALAARSLPGRLRTQARLVIGLALTATGEVALSGLGTGASWARLLPGLFVAGVGSGIANASLGRIAVESVPHDRVGMGSGANNTARYLGGAAGVALVVTLASNSGENGLIHGWNVAALVSAGLCALGALIVASSRAR
jgi:fucose permease